MYSAVVLDHFHNPRNPGKLEDADAVGTGGTPGYGNFVQLYVRIRGGRVDAITFKTHGCAATIAASSFITEWAQGKTVAECLAFTAEELLEALGGLPPGREHATELTIAALRDAVTKEAPTSHG